MQQPSKHGSNKHAWLDIDATIINVDTHSSSVGGNDTDNVSHWQQEMDIQQWPITLFLSFYLHIHVQTCPEPESKRSLVLFFFSSCWSKHRVNRPKCKQLRKQTRQRPFRGWYVRDWSEPFVDTSKLTDLSEYPSWRGRHGYMPGFVYEPLTFANMWNRHN